MKIDLSGKKALVGGSSKGIGLGIARQLAESGASVCLMARDKIKLEEIIDELPKNNYQDHKYLLVDFSNFEKFKSIIKNYLSTNSIDILVNNTQGPPAGNSLSKDIESYQEAFDLLFKCVVYTTSLVVPQMQKKKWGRIINVTSVSVKEPLNYLVLSNSIRSALVAWAKSLSVDIGKDGITINSILTGYFDTERIKELNKEKSKSLNISEDEVLEKMKSLVPVNRLGKIDEYGYLVSFLSSDKAAYINGTSIPIDGGLLKSY
jgi:3-oxoacyl-[acyl-carrier protein] reductase